MLLNTNLATKADIAQVEATLKVDIARVEATLKVDIAQAKQEMIKWMVGGVVLGVAVVQTTLIVGLLS